MTLSVTASPQPALARIDKAQRSTLMTSLMTAPASASMLRSWQAQPDRQDWLGAAPTYRIVLASLGPLQDRKSACIQPHRPGAFLNGFESLSKSWPFGLDLLGPISCQLAIRPRLIFKFSFQAGIFFECRQTLKLERVFKVLCNHFQLELASLAKSPYAYRQAMQGNYRCQEALKARSVPLMPSV